MQTLPLWGLRLPELGVGIPLSLSEITHSTNFFLRAYYVLVPVPGTGDMETNQCWTLPAVLSLSWVRCDVTQGRN